MKTIEITVAIFLDIGGIFNNACQSARIEKNNWIAVILQKNYIDLITERGDQIQVGKRMFSRGDFSSILWAVVVDDLLAVLSLFEIVWKAYADNLAILVKGESEELISKLFQIILTTIGCWCGRDSMFMNLPKMGIVLGKGI